MMGCCCLPASGNSSNINPLYLACVNGHPEVADYLISKKICDVKGKTCESAPVIRLDLDANKPRVCVINVYISVALYNVM